LVYQKHWEIVKYRNNTDKDRFCFNVFWFKRLQVVISHTQHKNRLCTTNWQILHMLRELYK